MSRESSIEQFLYEAGWGDAQRTALSQDASFRRYWRLSIKGKRAMLMDAPPPEKPVSLFADIARFLNRNGLSAPDIYSLDDQQGLMLLEDFGDDTFTQILVSEPDAETKLYELAIDVLVKLQQIEPVSHPDLPPYDGETLVAEARLFTEWFYPYIKQHKATQIQSQQYDQTWQQIIATLPHVAEAVVLRDYHVDNLMRLDGNRCGLLDFQDALIGSPAYDLVSLLEDARRDISPELQQHCMNRYFSGMGLLENNPERVQLRTWMNVLGAQRHAKVLGIFVRLYQRDGKSHYLQHLPRVWSLYRSAIEREPLLQPVADWMAENLPFDTAAIESLSLSLPGNTTTTEKH